MLFCILLCLCFLLEYKKDKYGRKCNTALKNFREAILQLKKIAKAAKVSEKQAM